MNKQNGLSVVITVKNEVDKIARCLESVKWANEIIIIDNGSTDSTLDICRKYSDKIFFDKSAYSVFIVNTGIGKAAFEWILNVDADEVISEKLKAEILEKIQSDNHAYNGYFIPVKDYFMGKWLRYGGWCPSYIRRLYRNGKAKYLRRDFHVQVEIDGKVGYLSNPIMHYAPNDIFTFIRKMNHYTTNAAQMDNGRRKISFFSTILKPPLIFIKRYFLLKGFLDGFPGFAIATLSAIYIFIDNMKLIEFKYLKEVAIKNKRAHDED